MDKNIKSLIMAAVFSSLTAVATLVLRIPIGGGFINAGDGVIILSGVFLSPVFAFLSSAVGAVAADAISGFMIYAPATFLIKGLMALVVALLMKNREITKRKMIFPAITAELIMLIGYFIYEIFVFGISYAVVSATGDTVQAVCGLLIAVFSAPSLARININRR